MDTEQKRRRIGALLYRNRRGDRALVEVKSFREMRRIGSDGHLAGPHRLDFHIVLYARRGGGSHWIDFNEYSLSRGSLVAGHPGEVQRFGLGPRANGVVLLFAPAATGGDRLVGALLDPAPVPQEPRRVLPAAHAVVLCQSSRCRTNLEGQQ